MDPHLGDSSSDSDISNSWSIVDQDLCSAETTQRENSVDKDSISGSDGDSLEVIEDEEKRDTDEFRDADVETDGISIITESEINEELDQALAWTEPKEKKYLHRPNTYLNSRLNVLLAISLAAVFGLGLGHFLGLQEECPLLNESVTAQIEKLQQENQLLRNQLEKLLHNERTFSMAVKTALDLSCNKEECQSAKQTSDNPERYIEGSDWSLLSSDKLELEAEPVSKETAVESNAGSADKAQIATQDYLRNTEPEWVRTYPWPKSAEAEEEMISTTGKDNSNNEQSSLKITHPIEHLQNDDESPIDMPKENIALDENVLATDSVKPNDKEEQTKKQIPHDRKDQSIEAVRMALSLLESHFTLDDRTSPDAKDTLSSAQSLTSDLEQSLVQLQTAITSSEVDRSGFFGQVLKKMKESVNRVMNTMEEVADDVDEQMHKALYKLTRKLKKLKGKLQEKWCHLSEKYNNKSHAVLDWLHSKILVDCKKPNDKSIEERVQMPKGGERFQMPKGGERVQMPKGGERVQMPKGERVNKKDFPAPPLNEEEFAESFKILKLSHNDKSKYNEFGELDAENTILKSKLEVNNEPPLILDTPLVISEAFLKPDDIASNGFLKHDMHALQKTDKLNSETSCWQAQHGKMDCKKDKKPRVEKESVQKSKHNEKPPYKKIKSLKPVSKVDEKSKAKPEEQKRKYDKSKPLEQGGWVLPDVNNNIQNNASGEWMMKLAKGRAEQRRLVHRSDWVFDRAQARRVQRDIDKKKAHWYFQRAEGREYCRYHPQSEDCQTSKSHNFQWDGSNADKFRKHYTEDKSHYFTKWSKKFGKWMKNSFSNWHKVKYHSQH